MGSDSTGEERPVEEQAVGQEQGAPDRESNNSAPGAGSRSSRKKAGAIVAIVVILGALGVLGVNGGWFARMVEGGGGMNRGGLPDAPPEIVALSASSDRILPLDTVVISCEAFHPENSALTYEWSCSDGEMSGEGSTAEWTAPDKEGLYQVTVSVVDEAEHSVKDSLALRVRDNMPPEILVMESGLDEDVEWVVPGTGVHVRCDTEDADGDELAYAWSATAGDVYGQGKSIIWIAPDVPDTYWVTLEVEDTYGATAERSLPMTVNVAEPPIIHGFSLEALDTDMFRPYGDSWRIFKERSCSIHAQVDDAESVYSYRWTAEAGAITWDGPDAVWSAPTSKGWVDILLRVSDRHGNESTASVRIFVETCPSCM